MTCSALPPVRRPVSLSRGNAGAGWEALRAYFGAHDVFLFQSGTAALAVALDRCRSRHGAKDAQIILPAYACPDLVSACVYAGVQPKLVDVAADRWGYDEVELARAMSSKVAGIVAMNFLGTGDDAVTLAKLAAASGALLIQDSAQYMPRHAHDWCGDYVVVSFGRGKPLNLLRGGALISRRTDASLEQEAFDAASPELRLRERVAGSRLAGVAFNAMTSTVLYGWISRLPGLGLGSTAYKPLQSIVPLPFDVAGQVAPALQHYRSVASYRAALWSEVLPGWKRLGLKPLAELGDLSDTELLRLPLLAPDRTMRDRVVEELNRAGLGASIMYGLPMHRLPGIPAAVAAQGPFPNATQLADRLFTLPTHAQVTPRVVARTDAIVRNVRDGN